MKNTVTKEIDGVVYYLCNKCKKWLTKEHFNVDNTFLHGNRGGLCRECKDCQKERYYKERAKLLQDDHLAWKYKLTQALKGVRRRSKLKNNYTDIDLEFLMYLWNKQNGKCALTGMDMTYKFYEGRVNTNVSVDRIDSSKGYTRDNVQLVCMAANQMKNDLSMNEFVDMCERVIALEREKIKARTAIRNKTAGEK